jgi:hypothetical protein
MGQAIVNNYDIEVSSMGEMIPSGTNIEIIKIENTKIYIKQTTI